MSRQSNDVAGLTIGNEQIVFRTAGKAPVCRAYADEPRSDSVREALGVGLAHTQALRRVDIEIGDSLVYYDVLDLDARNLPYAEVQRLAALALADTFGLDPQQHAVRCTVQRGGKSVVACSVPHAVLEAALVPAREAGLRARQLQPAFIAFLKRRANEIGKDGLVGLLDARCLTLGLLEQGIWKAIAVQSLASTEGSAIRHACESFCRRHCLEDADSLPIWLEIGAAQLDPHPGEHEQRWHVLGVPEDLVLEAN